MSSRILEFFHINNRNLECFTMPWSYVDYGNVSFKVCFVFVKWVISGDLFGSL